VWKRSRTASIETGTTSSTRRAYRVRPVPVLQWAAVRLRTLSEAECYARCYGGRGDERVTFVKTVKRAPVKPVERPPLERKEAA